MTDTTREFDGYALDDTLEGRLTQAAAAGILTALPDYFEGKTLWALYAAGFLGFGALIAYTNAEFRDEAEEAARQERIEQELEEQKAQAEEKIGAKNLSYLLPVAVVGVGAATLALNVATSKKVAEFLRGKGVGKPWSVMGAAAAGLIFVLSEAEARDHARSA